MLVPEIFADDLFDNFFLQPLRYSQRAQKSNAMQADVIEYADHYQLKLQLPGFKKEEIQAELKDGYLTIDAVHQKSEEKETGRYLRRECYSGNYERSFYVGEQVEQEDIRAGFENGMLSIDVPKQADKPQVEKKKMIPIEG